MPFRLDPDDRRCVQKQNEDGSWERLDNSPCHSTVEDAIARLQALRINVSSQESKLSEQSFTNRDWNGDKSRFTTQELINAVPDAVAEWARDQTPEDEPPNKTDLKLPYKEPDGTINLNGVRAALAAIGGARIGEPPDLPADVLASAEEELEAALERGKEALGLDDDDADTEESVNERLQESWSAGHFFSEAEVDRRENVIRNVKLLGRKSENGRVYSEQAMRDATGLYNGVPFYIDHPTESELKERGGTRSVHDLAGKIRNPRMGHNEVRGDLHLLEREPHKGLVFSIAEQMPDMAGMSHRAEGHLRRTEDGEDVVENLSVVHAHELVTQPATTNGLFESLQSQEDDVKLDELTMQTLTEERPDLVEKIREDADESTDVETLREKNKELREKVDRLEAEKREREHAEMVEAKLDEADLPDRVVSDTFREMLGDASSEEEVDALIEDRKEVVESFRTSGPRSLRRRPDVEDRPSEPTDQEIMETFGV